MWFSCLLGDVADVTQIRAVIDAGGAMAAGHLHLLVYGELRKLAAV